jgi:hypothetical protein
MLRYPHAKTIRSDWSTGGDCRGLVLRQSERAEGRAGSDARACYHYIPPTTTEVATGTTSAPTTPDEIELDLTKLQGKDRLYTEEEGKYENLSEEERRVVVKAWCKLHNINEHESTYSTCTGVLAYFINRSRLVSLKNNTAIIYGPSESEAIGSVITYNIAKNKITSSVPDSHNFAFDSNYIIHLEPVSPKESKDGIIWVFKYYRPGMDNFVEIPGSATDLTANGLHTYYSLKLSSVNFNGDLLTANIDFYNCDESETGYPTDCVQVNKETKTFDLSNLQ